MKALNWELIDEATGGDRLPAGGYVVRITAVEDVPSRDYMWIEYDIAEGPHAGHFDDDFAKSHPYIHRFSRSYSDKAQPFFKAFLVKLQESNPGHFDWRKWAATSDEQAFVGLEVGLVLREEQYTNEKGDDKTRLNMYSILAADAIRQGDYTVPEPEDNRTSVGSPSGVDDDVPF